MSKSVFRLLLLVSLAVQVADFALEFLLPAHEVYPDLLPALENYLGYSPLIDYSDPTELTIFLVVMGIWSLLVIVPYVGLFLLYRWARHLYAVMILVLGLLITSIVVEPGPQLFTSYSVATLWLNAFLCGVLLVAMWSEPLASQFRSVRKEAL